MEQAGMGVEELKAAIKGLKAEDRRKVALYILELERDHLQNTIGPQIAQDLESVGRAIQDTVERIRKQIKNNL